MTETDDFMSCEERQAWLRSAQAWRAAFPQFANLVARIEARLLAVHGDRASHEEEPPRIN